MDTAPTFLPDGVTLPSGLVVHLGLSPMPTPGENGRYPIRTDVGIHVRVLRDGVLVQEAGWGDVISVARTVRLSDGTLLDEEDLHVLDSEGWALMLRYGIVPTIWIDR